MDQCFDCHHDGRLCHLVIQLSTPLSCSSVACSLQPVLNTANAKKILILNSQSQAIFEEAELTRQLSGLNTETPKLLCCSVAGE